MRRVVFLSRFALALLVSSGAVIAAEAEDCEQHAAAMVAEMQSSSDAPLAEDQVKLIRETALRSCRARVQGADQPSSAAPQDAAPAGAPPPAPVAGEAAEEAEDDAEDGSIWDSIKERMKTPPAHKEGHDRLKRIRTGGM